MTMFDPRVAAVLDDFGTNWGTPEHKFRQYASFSMQDDGSISLRVRCNGHEKEFLRMPHDQYERCIRLPVQATRQGSNYSTRFFAWHWLEETNQLDLFFNKVKELQNA